MTALCSLDADGRLFPCQFVIRDDGTTLEVVGGLLASQKLHQASCNVVIGAEVRHDGALKRIAASRYGSQRGSEIPLVVADPEDFDLGTELHQVAVGIQAYNATPDRPRIGGDELGEFFDRVNFDTRRTEVAAREEPGSDDALTPVRVPTGHHDLDPAFPSSHLFPTLDFSRQHGCQFRRRETAHRVPAVRDHRGRQDPDFAALDVGGSPRRPHEGKVSQRGLTQSKSDSCVSGSELFGDARRRRATEFVGRPRPPPPASPKVSSSP